jgi:hypothetical protein
MTGGPAAEAGASADGVVAEAADVAEGPRDKLKTPMPAAAATATHAATMPPNLDRASTFGEDSLTTPSVEEAAAPGELAACTAGGVATPCAFSAISVGA